jgi:hypothetical protein
MSKKKKEWIYEHNERAAEKNAEHTHLCFDIVH